MHLFPLQPDRRRVKKRRIIEKKWTSTGRYHRGQELGRLVRPPHPRMKRLRSGGRRDLLEVSQQLGTEAGAGGKLVCGGLTWLGTLRAVLCRPYGWE